MGKKELTSETAGMSWTSSVGCTRSELLSGRIHYNFSVLMIAYIELCIEIISYNSVVYSVESR